MKERIFKVRNKAGIHCRPSSVILNTIKQEFPFHRFEIVSANGEAELTGMLALISLGLACGSEGLLRVEGPDEDLAVQRIGDLLEHEFDFPPR